MDTRTFERSNMWTLRTSLSKLSEVAKSTSIRGICLQLQHEPWPHEVHAVFGLPSCCFHDSEVRDLPSHAGFNVEKVQYKNVQFTVWVSLLELKCTHCDA